MNPTLIAIGLASVFTWSLFGQAASEPKELSDLRTSFEKARAAAVSPLEKKYSDALGMMKERFTKAGNLEAALAVDAELKRLILASAEKASPQAAEAGSSKAKLKATLPTLHLEGTWAYGDFVLFFSDTEATLSPESKFSRKGAYEVIAARKVKVTLPIRATVPNDREMEFEFELSKELTEFTSSRADLKGKVLANTPK